MSKVFVKTEKGILGLSKKGALFTYNGSQFRITKSGKPMPTDRGECKTDVYIEAENIRNNTKHEFKISIKQSNAHFLENKMTKERALQIFGKEFSEIIQKSILKLKTHFESEDLIFYEQKGNTQAKSIKMGWRFELFLIKQGNKSELMELTDIQKLDVFAGTNLSVEKKNSRVADEVIVNSGIANFVLVVDETIQLGNNLNEYIQLLKPIEEYAHETPIYFGCKALNYRASKKGRIKWEGDRSLCVFVDWSLNGNKLQGKLIYSKPLEITGHQVGEQLSESLKTIGITDSNFEQLKKFIESNK